MKLRWQITALDGAQGPDLRRRAGRDPIDHLLASKQVASWGLLDGQADSALALGRGPSQALGAPSAPRTLAELRNLVEPIEVVGPEAPGPFRGGFLGALSYELGVAGDPLDLPPAARSVPPIAGGVATEFVAWEGERAWLVVAYEDGCVAKGGERTVTWLERLEAALGSRPEEPALPEPEGPLQHHRDAQQHRARVEELRAAIARGDLYQANLSRRYTRRLTGSPRDLYRRLRRLAPAPYSGYLEWEGGALLSASPELLLEVKGRDLLTSPIKGTRGRSVDAERDEQQARELLASEKDRAELAMIVDLERNDLARVCEPGSVRVAAFPRLASFASVHHLIADVHGRLRDDCDAVHALEALFPGGSITGAPKLAAMRHLAGWEEQGRGYFTGSLGTLGFDGSARFNILIRSLVWHDLAWHDLAASSDGRRAAEVEFWAGGGITWRSDAGEEEEETRIKAAAMAALLRGRGEAPDSLGVELRGIAKGEEASPR